jgi:guanylate kinase
MIVLVGASASGKTELAKMLFNKYGYKKCITTTTRKPRDNEKNNVDYHFLTDDEFLDLKERNKFLEVSIYDHHYYGIQKNDVSYKGVVVVDPNGANSIVEKSKKEVFVVYVKANEETRIKRMKNRGDQLEKINKRVLNDREVFVQDKINKIDLIIENEDTDLSELALLIHQKYMKTHEK